MPLTMTQIWEQYWDEWDNLHPQESRGSCTTLDPEAAQNTINKHYPDIKISIPKYALPQDIRKAITKAFDTTLTMSNKREGKAITNDQGSDQPRYEDTREYANTELNAIQRIGWLFGGYRNKEKK